MLSETQKNQIREKLQERQQTLLNESDRAINDLKDVNTDDFSDPFDRAKTESDNILALRLKDRERKLYAKTFEALERLENDKINICEDCGDEIDFSRLLVRPVTTQCVLCKEIEEQEERSRS